MQLRFEDALAVIAQVAGSHRLPSERIALARAHGRILAQDVVATLPLPPFDNSAMDGIAYRHADLVSAQSTGLRLVGEQFAGVRQDLVVGPGECVRITTGAPLPPGADTIAIREALRMDGEQRPDRRSALPGARMFDMRAKTSVSATWCFGRAMR